MVKIMKNTTVLTVIKILIFYATAATAQPALPSPPDQAPIDGGLGILAAAGGAYAIKKLRDRKKRAEDQNSEF